MQKQLASSDGSVLRFYCSHVAVSQPPHYIALTGVCKRCIRRVGNKKQVLEGSQLIRPTLRCVILKHPAGKPHDRQITSCPLESTCKKRVELIESVQLCRTATDMVSPRQQPSEMCVCVCGLDL